MDTKPWKRRRIEISKKYITTSNMKKHRGGFKSIVNLGAYKRLGYINANVEVTKASAVAMDSRQRIYPRKSRSWT